MGHLNVNNQACFCVMLRKVVFFKRTLVEQFLASAACADSPAPIVTDNRTNGDNSPQHYCVYMVVYIMTYSL